MPTLLLEQPTLYLTELVLFQQLDVKRHLGQSDDVDLSAHVGLTSQIHLYRPISFVVATDQLFSCESRAEPNLKVSQVPENGTEGEQVDWHQGYLCDPVLKPV